MQTFFQQRPIPLPFPRPGGSASAITPVAAGTDAAVPTGTASRHAGDPGRTTRATPDDRVNVAALRDITDDSGGRTEVIRTARDLDPATAGIADELSRQVLHRLRLDRRQGRPLALDPGRSARRQLSRPGTPRLRRRDALGVQSKPLISFRGAKYTAAVGLSVLGSLGGLLAASAFLLLGDGLRTRLVPWAISYAVGTLLGVALLALLPEALGTLPPPAALGTLLAGVLTFFLLEKLVLWRHCHDGTARVRSAHQQRRVAGHHRRRLPHLRRWRDHRGRGADLDSARHHHRAGGGGARDPAGSRRRRDPAARRLSRSRALTLNMLSGLGGVLGAIAMLTGVADRAATALPYVLAFAAGNFLYIAMADLIPDLHRGERRRRGRPADGPDRRRHPDDRAPVE